MNRLLYLLVALVLTSCYTPMQVCRFEPSKNEQIIDDQGHIYSCKSIDSVFISLEFIRHFNNEFIFDLTIDNQSNDTFEFDPSEIYLFRYSSDTLLAEARYYHPIDPDFYIDSIKNATVKQQSRVNRSAIFSVLLAAAYLTTEIVAATSDDISYETMEVVRAGHEISQIALDQSRIDALNSIDQLYYTEDYWKSCVMKKTFIEPDTFYSGNIHFKAYFSQKYKIYVPADNHIFGFSFNGISETK